MISTIHPRLLESIRVKNSVSLSLDKTSSFWHTTLSLTIKILPSVGIRSTRILHRGGLILCREKYAKQIDKAIFPGTQGGPLMHIIAAKAVAFGEAMTDEFKEYQKQIIKNAKVLCNALTEAGFRIVSGDTDNHLMLIDLRAFGITGKEMEKRLDEVHITVNKNAIPNDPETPFVTSGIRVGTPAVTSRGFKEAEMLKIAGWIKDIATDFEGNRERVTAEVMALCEKFPIYN